MAYVIKETATAKDSNPGFPGETRVHYFGTKDKFWTDGAVHGLCCKMYGYKSRATAERQLKKHEAYKSRFWDCRYEILEVDPALEDLS